MKAIFGGTAQTGSVLAFRRRVLDFWTHRRLEIRHGLRIAAGGLFSYAVGHMLGLPQVYWAVFTSVLVIQGSVGGSWKASIDRFIGTLFGAAYGAAVATLVPHGDTVMTGVALAISLVPLSIMAAFSPAFRVAPVTAIILLLGNTGATEGPLVAAMLRTLEVALGGLCGIFVSLFLFPARAHVLLGKSAGNVLEQLSTLFPDLASAIIEHTPLDKVSAKQDGVRAALADLQNIVTEAARERRNHLSDDVDPEPISRTLWRVRNDLILITRIASEPVIHPPSPEIQNCLRQFADTGAKFLRDIGMAFANRQPPPAFGPMESAINIFLAALEKFEPEERIVALRFCLQQLQHNLSDLCHRADEFAAAPAARRHQLPSTAKT